MAKARKAKLKVFRTPIGFHDAYVAAPSQKAALAAWGTDTNLFAAGVAEIVTDPTLTKAPLARPGKVVRVLRGSEVEQIRALGAIKKKEAGPRIKSGVTKRACGSRVTPGMTKNKTRGPRPSSAAVDRAETALARADKRHRDELDKLRAQAAALDRKRRELERGQRAERERLNEALDTARERFRQAMEEWAG